MLRPTPAVSASAPRISAPLLCFGDMSRGLRITFLDAIADAIADAAA
jgi:hypothetical protein